jgi:hypothetical protein
MQTFVCYVYCCIVACTLYTLEFRHTLFNTDRFLLQVSTGQLHLSERTEVRTGRLAFCLSNFTTVGTVQHQIEEISNVE